MSPRAECRAHLSSLEVGLEDGHGRNVDDDRGVDHGHATQNEEQHGYE